MRVGIWSVVLAALVSGCDETAPPSPLDGDSADAASDAPGVDAIVADDGSPLDGDASVETADVLDVLETSDSLAIPDAAPADSLSSDADASGGEADVGEVLPSDATSDASDGADVSGDSADLGTDSGDGAGASSDTSSDTAETAAPTVVGVSAGQGHTCAWLSDGAAWCWGHNDTGQVGDGTKGTDRLAPTKVVGLSNVAEIAAGDIHTCARLTDGTAKCWGDNGFGEVGVGSGSGTYTKPAATLGITGVTSISSGRYHSCARISDGTVWCWGYGALGQIGDGGFLQRNSPTKAILAGALSTSVGGYHSCARMADDTVTCWGDNDYGQLGDGSTTARNTPTAVPSLTGITQLAAEWKYTAARRSDGTILSWGRNANGVLGDGTTTDHVSATASLVSGATAVGLGLSHACARRTDGAVVCWGANYAAQLGDGTLTSRLTAAPVVELTNVAQLSVKGDHACAVKSDGTLWCWGYNAWGEVGDGTTTKVSTPFQVKF